MSGHMRMYQRAVAVNLISSKHVIIYMGVGFYSILLLGRFSQRTEISIYPDLLQRKREHIHTYFTRTSHIFYIENTSWFNSVWSPLASSPHVKGWVPWIPIGCWAWWSNDFCQPRGCLLWFNMLTILSFLCFPFLFWPLSATEIRKKRKAKKLPEHVNKNSITMFKVHTYFTCKICVKDMWNMH